MPKPQKYNNYNQTPYPEGCSKWKTAKIIIAAVGGAVVVSALVIGVYFYIAPGQNSSPGGNGNSYSAPPHTEASITSEGGVITMNSAEKSGAAHTVKDAINELTTNTNVGILAINVPTLLKDTEKALESTTLSPTSMLKELSVWQVPPDELAPMENAAAEFLKLNKNTAKVTVVTMQGTSCEVSIPASIWGTKKVICSQDR